MHNNHIRHVNSCLSASLQQVRIASRQVSSNFLINKMSASFSDCCTANVFLFSAWLAIGLLHWEITFVNLDSKAVLFHYFMNSGMCFIQVFTAFVSPNYEGVLHSYHLDNIVVFLYYSVNSYSVSYATHHFWWLYWGILES